VLNPKPVDQQGSVEMSWFISSEILMRCFNHLNMYKIIRLDFSLLDAA